MALRVPLPPFTILSCINSAAWFLLLYSRSSSRGTNIRVKRNEQLVTLLFCFRKDDSTLPLPSLDIARRFASIRRKKEKEFAAFVNINIERKIKTRKMPGICPRCQKNVYFAEEKMALGKSFHKMCFACANCKKMLDSTNATEHDDELFCRSCYGKKFGPKGYGYGGGGAGVLSMDDGTGYINGPPTSNIPQLAQAHVAPLLANGGTSVRQTNGNGYSKFGSKIDCRRCGKVVFMAEKMMGGGSCWHKSCFTCLSCNKRLESTSLCEREGEIYCKSCYGKQFGPKGYGFGLGAGVLQMSE
ncbi:cysteine and glycine-rich protein 1 isoform X1 [Daphnia magna]|uniref:cysteine and glycine-rich protein 1 isoform X1 n=1 Tax=Daphnia magna TaxID=35525 RepID=UPI001E1BC2FE|nr:cysteine and glycine-rich protein 1 isoform X1 [Daphnia magna]